MWTDTNTYLLYFLDSRSRRGPGAAVFFPLAFPCAVVGAININSVGDGPDGGGGGGIVLTIIIKQPPQNFLFSVPASTAVSPFSVVILVVPGVTPSSDSGNCEGEESVVKQGQFIQNNTKTL